MTCPNCGGENLTDYPVCMACAPKCHAIGRIEIGLNCIHCDIQMAAFPLMLETLNAAREYVGNAVTNCRECGEADAIAKRDQMISAIDAAIAAAEEE